jgi:protoheme IX farnesyltransferase
MLPVVAGAKETRRQIALYTLILVPLSLAPWLVGFSGPIYAAVASTLGAAFLASVWRVFFDRQDAAGVSLTNDAPARAAFKYSILYLFALFGALAVDRIVG